MTRPKKTSKLKGKDKAKINLTIPAFFISVLSLLISSWFSLRATLLSNDANQIAEEAQRVAEEANEIALGRLKAYPYIKIPSNQFEEKIDLLSENDLSTNDFEILVANSGDVGIDQIAIEVIGIPGLFYSIDPVYQEFEFSKRSDSINVDLNQILTPGGMAFLDLKAPILGYLHEAFIPSLNDQSLYIIAFNIVFAPRRLGDSLPVQTPGNPDNDRQIVTIITSSSMLESEELKNLDKNFVPTRVYPGTSP